MKHQTTKTVYRKISFLVSVLCVIMHIPLHAESALNIFHDIEYAYGLYAIDIIKMLLGIITIIGAFGFFITTSTKRAHWPPHFRRLFFGTFIFCNIFFQALFNVINIPNNRKIICTLGKCIRVANIKK